MPLRLDILGGYRYQTTKFFHTKQRSLVLDDLRSTHPSTPDNMSSQASSLSAHTSMTGPSVLIDACGNCEEEEKVLDNWRVYIPQVDQTSRQVRVHNLSAELMVMCNDTKHAQHPTPHPFLLGGSEAQHELIFRMLW